MSDSARNAAAARHFRDVLVHDREWVRLYHEEPEFHHAIDLIGNVLPMLLDSLAVSATEAGRRRSEAIRMAQTMPPLPWIPKSGEGGRP